MQEGRGQCPILACWTGVKLWTLASQRIISPVERGGIIHRDESEELVETGRDSLPVDIVDNDAPPEDLVPEGGVESGHGVAPDNEPNVLPELIRQTRDIFLLGVP